MSVLTIDTKLTIPNGIDIVQLGAILQNFTDDYLYVILGNLCSVSDFSTLETGYKLAGHDGGFELSKDESPIIYCYRKDLLNYLVSSDNILGQVSRSDPRKEYETNFTELCNRNSKKFSDESGIASKFFGNVIEQEDDESYPEVDFKYLAELDKKDKDLYKTEQEKTKLKNKETKLKNKETKLKNKETKLKKKQPVPIKKNKKEGKPKKTVKFNPKISNPIENSEECSEDAMAQSRINSSRALVEAIKQNRKKRRQGTEKFSESLQSSEEGKVCSVVAGLLKTKAANKQKQDISDDKIDVEDNNDKEKINLPEPVLPRFYSDKGELFSLPEDLKNYIAKIVFKDGNGTFYFDGATIRIEDGNVYDLDNVMNVPRLNPKKFSETWDGKPGSLPIAQFKITQYHYKLFIEPKINTWSPTKNFTEFNLNENNIREFCKQLVSEHSKLIFGDIVFDIFEEFGTVTIKVLEHPDSNTTLSLFHPVDLDDDYKLMFHLTTD